MSKEIRKETDWLGIEKDVIYEDGQKVGETRHETTLFGTSKEVTYDTHRNKISETIYEEGIFGGKKGVIRESGRKIGELKTEKGIFGERKQVLHEIGEDVDLTKRVTREKSSQTSRSYSDYDYGEQTEVLQEESKKRKLKETTKPERRLHVYSNSSPQAIKRELDTGLYNGVTFIPDTYLVTYKCDRCGHEFDCIVPETFLGAKEFVDCRMGCSRGANEPSLLGLYKIIKGLITGKEPFGYGRLIKKKKL